MILVSACLIGFPCRYNAVIQKDVLEDVLFPGTWASIAIPVCPEVLGGLSVPRPPSEISMGAGGDVLAGRAKVRNARGDDVTSEYVAGAWRGLLVGLQAGCRVAILKDRSPSCGAAGFIYDGTFTRTRKAGDGVFAALLRHQGFRVYSENQAEEAMAFLSEQAHAGLKGIC